MDAIGPGSLKCVVGSSDRRTVRDAIESALLAHVRLEDVRHLGGEAFAVYTEAAPDEIRDWLGDALEDGESAFVVEFERWSSRGPVADREWLLRRGH